MSVAPPPVDTNLLLQIPVKENTMLNLSRTLMHQSREIAFVPGYQAKEEGIPVVSILVDGEEAIKGFEGAADVALGARFTGFTYSESLTPLSATHALMTATDANGHVLLPYEPITGQVSVWKKVNGVRTRVANADVTIDGTNAKLVNIANSASMAIEVVYKYLPTLQTAFYEHRMLIPSVSASAMTNSSGVIIEGEVWTDKIDLASNFDLAAGLLYLNADGNLAMAAAVPEGGLAVNAQVIGTPNGTNGFLGIRY